MAESLSLDILWPEENNLRGRPQHVHGEVGQSQSQSQYQCCHSEESPEEMRNPESAQQGEFPQAQKLLVRCTELFEK